jgi:hypothetical protein
MATQEFKCDCPESAFNRKYESCLKWHLKIHGIKII